MRSLALLCLALLAACEQSGVQFIVEIPADYGDGPDADPQVQLPDEVRLFIGVGGENPDALGPEGFTVREKRSGTYWLRDPSNVDPEIDRAPIGVGSPAVFSFGHATGVDELPVVIAVGYTNGQPTSSAAVFHARVGASRVFQYRMGLNGAADPRDRTLRGRVNQLEIWGPDECIHVDNRRQDIQDTGHRVAFIVGSTEDRDCDGLRDDDPKECFDEVYMGEGLSEKPGCVHSNPVNTHCTVGVSRCRDSVGEDGSCNPSRFCLAQEVCSNCSEQPDAWACAQNYQSHNAAAVASYGLECQLTATMSSAGIELCKLSIQTSITPPPSTTCENVAVKALRDPEFDQSFSIGTGASTAFVKVSNNDCDLKIEPEGQIVGLADTTASFGALMLVALDQGLGIGVPIRIGLLPRSTCNEPGICRWVDAGGPDNPNECVQSMRP